MTKLFKIVVAITCITMGVLLGIAIQEFFLIFSTGLHVEKFSNFQLFLEILYLMMCGSIGFIIYSLIGYDDYNN